MASQLPAPARNQLRVSSDDLDRAVRRNSIDHEIVDGEVALLRDHAFDRLSDEGGLVKAGGDDRHRDWPVLSWCGVAGVAHGPANDGIPVQHRLSWRQPDCVGPPRATVAARRLTVVRD